MNSKAIKRQLLAAIAMVLVAALALGSSTYAWFVASGTVKATGMSVKAQSEGGIVIRFGTGNWGTVAEADMTTAKQLYPASTHNLQKWSHATAKEAQAKAADATTYSEITSQVITDGKINNTNQYVVMKEFEIRSTSTQNLSNGLKVKSISITKADGSLPTQNIAAALRVGIYLPANQVSKASDSSAKNPAATKIFGPTVMAANAAQPGNKATSPYTVHYVPGATSDVPGDTGEEVTLNSLVADDNDNVILSSEFSLPNNQTTGVKVQIVIWFEGEDNSLYSDNIDISDFSVSVDFESISGGLQAPGNT